MEAVSLSKSDLAAIKDSLQEMKEHLKTIISPAEDLSSEKMKTICK